ncbi:exodeoxyribonuclease VII large subunit [Desulfovibrio mangrovi]|uniref:exodeoxyribonuclease VII large subunit n=1 Tax=Desulfovibrio mangrovi TaxID=2976983 RepID=UPI002245205A|nr:exodeoxyribonuclease VII large subunit [Desulfovibrio mangrovi]UZP68645.1 exodeoxyribonuclease VII large subunit [Desulfovibrio mangrovi]
MSRIFSVRELTDAIKRTLEGAYPFVWVKGQVSNLTKAASGHVYFSLKDADATLNCVWFRTAQRGEESFDPLTGEVYEDGPRPSLAQTMREGMEIMCAGRLNVYPPRGAYQLVVEIAQDAGLGRLYLEFEELKRTLAAKGYFDAARKRALPYHPARVAVVTASTGAAIRDFLRIAGERGWGAEIRIYPSLVQGDAAPQQIVEALEAANAHGWADVIALVRGGGSIEDLWAFNDVRVADAVFGSAIPVISGVGHEVDVTIADLVADVRAATPSHAAQLLWPERATLMQTVDECQMRLQRRWESGMRERETLLAALSRGLAWLSPARQLQRLDERFEDLEARLARAMEGKVSHAEMMVQGCAERLVRAFGPDVVAQHALRVSALEDRLRWAGEKVLHGRQVVFERLSAQLAVLDPMRPLERGYSLVRQADGSILRSVHEVEVGSRLHVTVRDGVVETEVTGTEAAKTGAE